jgi:hypothetical protein
VTTSSQEVLVVDASAARTHVPTVHIYIDLDFNKPFLKISFPYFRRVISIFSVRVPNVFPLRRRRERERELELLAFPYINNALLAAITLDRHDTIAVSEKHHHIISLSPL